MIAAVLVPLLVLVAAVLLERYESRIAPRETARTRTDGAAPVSPARHLRVVRAADAPASPALAGALPRAS